MDVDGLTQIVDDSQLCSRIILGSDALGFAKLCPSAIRGFCLWRNRTWEPRLLASVVVSQLYDDKGHLAVLPAITPTPHEFLEVIGIGSWMACVGLALIPYDTIDGVGSQGIEYSIIERCWDVLQGNITTRAVRHLCTYTHFPRL